MLLDETSVYPEILSFPRSTDRRFARDPWLSSAFFLAAFLCVVNVYRAATQSYTIDEAFSFRSFVTPPLSEAWHYYDANNHVLLILLCRICLKTFGPSELSLRLPVLIGGAVYLFTTAKLAHKLSESQIIFTSAYACLALNPMILDFLSASRGYGLALGLFTSGLLLLISSIPEHPRRPFLLAAFCLGLSIAANLVFVIPVLAVIAACGFTFLLDRRPVAPIVLFLALPAAAIAFVIDIGPLLPMKPGALYYGSKTVWGMLDSLYRQSFQHHGWFGSLTMEALAVWAPGLIAGVAFLPVGAQFFVSKQPFPIRLVLFAFSLTVVLLLLFHAITGILLPFGRTGIYLPVLFVLALICTTRVFSSRWLSVPITFLLVIVTCCFIGQWNTKRYGEWAFDASTKRHMLMIASLPHPSIVRVAASTMLVESANYYRRSRQFYWLDPIVRDNLPQSSDFYLLLPQDWSLVQQRNLRILHKDSISYQILAIPQTQR